MRLVSISIFLLSTILGYTQDLGLHYVKSLKASTASDLVDINRIRVNANGTMFFGGSFSGTADFDPDPSTTLNRTANGVDIFIGKYTSDGDLFNSNSLIVSGDASTQYVSEMVVKGQSVYVTGAVSGIASFSTGVALPTNTVISNGNSDILLAKFDEGLLNIWAYTIGGTNADFGTGIAVDNAGNMYLTGQFQGTADFDPSGNGTAKSMTAPGSLGNIFIAKYNTDGELIWAHSIGGSFFDAGYDLKLDQSGNVVVTGKFNGTVDFDPGPGTSNISSSPSVGSTFIAKYTSDGNFIWAKSIIDAETVVNLAVSSTGDLAIVGYYQINNAEFDPGPGQALLPYANSLPDGFVAVYDSNGNYKWAKSIGGPNSSLEIPVDAAFVIDGSLFVSGNAGGDVDFNQQGSTPYVLTSSSSDDFLARYNADGSLDYAYLIGGSNAEYGNSITIDGGNLLTYGRMRSASVDFDLSSGTTLLTSSSMNDSYFAKYDYTAPKITKNNTTETATVGDDLTINLEVEDDESAVASVSIDYRGVSAPVNTPFDQVTLTPKGGNQFEGTIPSDNFDELGLEFQVITTNSVGVVGSSSIFTTNLNVPLGLSIPQTGTGNGDQADYRIISIPLNLTSKTVKSIFEDDLGPYDPNEYRLFSYSDKTSEMTANASLEIGKGYWFIVAGNDRMMNTGAGKTAVVVKGFPFTITLNQGWNLIGNPYNFNISWADMQAANGALTESLRIFDGSFKNGTQIDAMGGGFVFANDIKTIGFPVTKNPTVNGGRSKDLDNPNSREPLLPGDWEVNLNLRQGNSSYNLGGIGMRADAANGYDQYDEMTLPRFANYIEINHDKKLYGYPYSMDVIPTNLEKVWEFTIESTHAGNTTVSWDLTALSQLSNKLILVDLDNQWPVDMTATGEYTFNSNGVRHFKAVYGNSEFVKKEINGSQFVLYGVHPNPASHEASFTVSVPDPAQSSTMTVNLFSSLGQKIASYVYQVADSGIQEELLPLSRSSLSPGIYIVQVQYGIIQKQTRLVIK